ncbi:MAG: methylated-DNA--[protein]-cysteine S-methyltransferase [Pseudomonadota bacterium]
MSSLTRDTPLGPVTLSEQDGAITALEWGGASTDETPLLQRAHGQLGEYFDKGRQSFDLPLRPRGSATLLRFLDALQRIPFGETKTYGEIARDTGLSAQAAGQACGANPIAIIIPCHRVLGANGLGGFSARGGVETKVALLRHEGAAGLLI